MNWKNICNKMENLRIQEPVIKGKSWRSLDLANQSHTYISSQNATTSSIVTTAPSTNTSIQHNSLISNVPIHYQRHDFKNRRSSSEPAHDEPKISVPNQNSHNNTTINQNTNHNNTTIELDSSVMMLSFQQGGHKVSNAINKKPAKTLFCSLAFLSALPISSLLY